MSRSRSRLAFSALLLATFACGGRREPAFVTEIARDAPRDADTRPAGERAIIHEAMNDLDAARAVAEKGREELARLFADRARARFALADVVHERTAEIARLSTREAEVLPLEAEARAKERERIELTATVKNLEDRVEVLDRAIGPGTSRAASDAREEARRIATSAVLERAELFCKAAKLLGRSIPPELQVRLDRASRGVPPNPKANTPPSATSATARNADEAVALRAECLFALNRGETSAAPSRHDLDTRAEAAVKDANQRGFTANIDEVGVHIDLKSASLGEKELTSVAHVATSAEARIIFELPRSAVSAMAGYRASLHAAGLDAGRASYVVGSRRAAGTVGIALVLAR